MRPIVPGGAAALLTALALTLWPGGSTPARSDCIEAPNSQAPQGSHWYYHTDRVSQRKCWYLGQDGKKVQPAASGVRPAAKPPREMELAAGKPPQRGPRQPLAGSAEAATALPFDAARREALFREFLQWRQRQQAAP